MDIVLGALADIDGTGSDAGAVDGSTVQVSNNLFAAQPPGSASNQASLSHEENGPILYDEPNRTSAIDDIRSGVIYAFIFTIFFTFFLILPGIRNEKFPTILCIVPSLLVASIIVISIFGTTWHVGEAPHISAAYKAFSRDRIQGELNVRIGLNSVNISLRAYKYFVLHATDGPIIMENVAAFDNDDKLPSDIGKQLEQGSIKHSTGSSTLKLRRSLRQHLSNNGASSDRAKWRVEKREADIGGEVEKEKSSGSSDSVLAPRAKTKTTIRRLNVDINYNERFYWIEPQQMRNEYYQALARGLPYPILTVVEYLSQDEAGFNWSRQYRMAGYYSSILLWLSFCLCIVMFCLHCATPKYGIYTMQLLGLLLLFTNFIYAMLVPRGERELTIPFEGRSLRFRFGWNFWLVMIGGCVSLIVGTLIIIVDCFKPNFIFTTVLDVDFDKNCNQSRKRQKCVQNQILNDVSIEDKVQIASQRLTHPPFMNPKMTKARPRFKQHQQSTTETQSKHSHTLKNRKDGVSMIDSNSQTPGNVDVHL